MPEYKVPESLSDFSINFNQIKPLMTDTEAYYESSRCLFCYDAPCTKACPTGIDIPLFIRQINTGNISGAAKTIYDSNFFGAACGKVCPTEVLCEGVCVYNKCGVRPLEIGRLQNYAAMNAVYSEEKLYTLPEIGGKKTAVIGAGPAGISCACELRLGGCEVDIFEAEELPSGLTLFGIAPYKITNDEVLKEMEYLTKTFDLNIQYNKLIEKRQDLRRLEKHYDAVFLGIGLGSTIPTSLPGENLPGCIGATEFIRELKLRKQDVTVGRTVVVLGGGNTAMDAASEAARLGADSITLAYRRSKEEKKAYDFEYELAKGVGVRGIFNVSPVEIIGSSKVEGVKLRRTKTENGRITVIPESDFIIGCDMVIRATGQEKKVNFLEQIESLEYDSLGKIVVDPVTFQTGNPKYFAGGDAVNGGAEVVNAAAEGKAAARGILAYLKKGGHHA